MTLNLSDARWLKAILLLAAPILAILAGIWLSGYFFLGLAGLDNQNASLTTIYEYWHYYGTDEKVRSWLILCSIGGFLLVLAPLGLAFVPKKKSLFGDAKWASDAEIRKAGLYADDGIIVGQKTSLFGLIKKYLIFGGSQHIIMAAPTRSGKGVSVVIPNLLSWQQSVVVLDIKQENWDITAGYRAAHGQECYLLNLAPRDYRSHHWNPLHYVSEDRAFRINDIQKIGNMLFPTNEHESPIWQASSRSLWLGMVLYLFETDDLPVTMGEVQRQLTMGDERLADIVEERQKGENPLSDECYLALKEYLDTPEKTRGGIRKSFTSALELFYNPVIDAVTSENDFDLRDIRKKRMSIYIGITPDDLDRLAPLINLFFQQVIDLNTRELPEQNPDLKYQVLLLPDEFTAMGRVGILSKGISYIAGYGLRMLPIIQSPAQLRNTYGADEAETFMENHALRIIFAPKDEKVAQDISNTLGTTTVKNKSRSRQLMSTAAGSESASDHGRALLLPQEVRGIGQSAEILILENCRPIKCEKVTWYADKVFRDRGNNIRAIASGDSSGLKWKEPKVPIVDPDANVKGAIDFVSGTAAQAAKTIVERPVTAEDISKIDEMDLSDFSCDFSDIDVPTGEIDDAALDALADQFFDKIAA